MTEKDKLTIKKEIEFEKKARLSSIFFSLAMPAALVLLGLSAKTFAPSDNIFKNIFKYSPAYIYEAWIIRDIYNRTKKIKKLEKSELKPTTEEDLDSYELIESYFKPVEKAKKKSKKKTASL